MMPSVHFVQDYERHLDDLLSQHSIDEAMSLAIGGSYDLVGAPEADSLSAAGLSRRMYVLDLGCRSGRTASHTAKRFPEINYIGTMPYATGRTHECIKLSPVLSV